MKSPIFILSLPRSGSTLLQKILGAHDEVRTISEPWILLPLVSSRKSEGTVSYYSHASASVSIKDFIKNMKGGEDKFIEITSNYIRQLYEEQCLDKEKYFLDKTPRYHYIIDDIIQLFPNAKFIFLFRNPLHIYNSILKTWCQDGFKNFHAYENDLTFGFQNLSKGFEKHKRKSISICYEDLIENTNFELNRICEYLDIDFDSNLSNTFSETDLKGKMGDPSNNRKLRHINSSSNRLDSITNRFKKNIAKKILNDIDDKAYTIQGYDKEKVLEELDLIKSTFSKSIIVDYFTYKSGVLIKKHNLNLILNTRTKRLVCNNYLN